MHGGGICMQCRMVELRYKEVINICDGCRLGYVGDVEVLLPEGRVSAWDCIKQIGDDIILIDKPAQRRPPYQERRKRRGLFG